MLRLCLGEFNGRKLQLPPQSLTRPASQKVRHSIFNILAHRYQINWPDTIVLDVFAGSGAMGLEALSLGAKFVTYFENAEVVLQCIKNNIKALKVEDKTQIIKANLLAPLKNSPKHAPAHLCFIDPPYRIFDKVSFVLIELKKQGFVDNSTLFCLESSVKATLDPDVFKVDDVREFGQTAIHFAKLSEG